MIRLLPIFFISLSIFINGNSTFGYELQKCKGSPGTVKTKNEFNELLKNWKNCTGILLVPSVAKYLGDIKNGLANGFGVMIYYDEHELSGGTYIGYWKNDKKTGEGIWYAPDGSIREGIWKDDIFQYSKNILSINSNSYSNLDQYKSTCEELGFTPSTEKFGDCVMKLMDND